MRNCCQLAMSNFWIIWKTSSPNFGKYELESFLSHFGLGYKNRMRWRDKSIFYWSIIKLKKLSKLRSNVYLFFWVREKEILQIVPFDRYSALYCKHYKKEYDYDWKKFKEGLSSVAILCFFLVTWYFCKVYKSQGGVHFQDSLKFSSTLWEINGKLEWR